MNEPTVEELKTLIRNVLEVYENMTSVDYANGKDRVAREAMAQILDTTLGGRMPISEDNNLWWKND